MQSGSTIDKTVQVTGKQPEDRHRTSPPSLPTSSPLERPDSKSPLKVPEGVIVRTPSGKDCQGRKTPPRFFAITNEQLQQMQSPANSESIGPKHFQFNDGNQTVDEGQECSCTKSPRKTETQTTPILKDIRGRTEKTGGMIMLKSLLEAEIRRSDMTHTPKAQKADTQTERKEKIDQLSSPLASHKIKDTHQVDPCVQKPNEMTTPNLGLFGERRRATLGNHDANALTKMTSKPNNNPSRMLSTTEIFGRTGIPNPPKATDAPGFGGKSDGSCLDPSSSECRPSTSDHKVQKGSLLDMLLSSTDPFENHRIGRPPIKKGTSGRSRKTTADIQDPKFTLDRTTTKPPNSPLSRRIVAPKCSSSGKIEMVNINSEQEVLDTDRRFRHGAGTCSSNISSNPNESNCRPKQTSTSVPEVYKEHLPMQQSRCIGAPVSISDKAESNITSSISQLPKGSNSEGEAVETPINSKAHEVTVSSLQSISTSLPIKSKETEMIHGYCAESGKVLAHSAGIQEEKSTDHAGKVSWNPSGEAKRTDDKTIAFHLCQKPTKTSDDMNDDSTPGQKQKATCPAKTTLIIKPVMTTPATVRSCSSGPSGQLYGLVRSSNNATGPVVLVALRSGPQNTNESTTLTGLGNNFNAVKPQSSTPVMINNMALTGNINTDAFNVWKSYVRKAYHDKYGTNCEYYMHNQWVSMSVAEKSPFVHQVQNRLHPPVVVKTSCNNALKTNQEVIVIKAPATKNSKPNIQRQINVIPRLQTTGPDRIIADNPQQAKEQDVLGELYRITNMADISSDFPMASNNSTLRKMMKNSSDFLTDPASGFDPLFAQCLLSGRRYDIDNWMAMRTNWRETPEWIVDFLADYDERKKARRAAIDAGVMRRVAMVQRMAGMQNDDDVAGASTVQTTQKHTGKKYPKFGDSKENTPKCQETTHENVSAGGLSPKLGASYKKDDKCLTPAKIPTATRTTPTGVAVVQDILHDQVTTCCEKPSPHSEFQPSSFDFKPENQPRVVIPMTPMSSHQAVAPVTSLPIGEDEGLPDALPTQNVRNNSTSSQKDSCHSQEENLIGDLDLIDDEELWNMQWNLFPPWQRVPSFIDADAAEEFLKDLDNCKDSVDVSILPSPPSLPHEVEGEIGEKRSLSGTPVDGETKFLGQVYQTEDDKHLGEALPSISSLIKEIKATEKNVSIIPSPISHTGKSEKKFKDLPHVKRCLFSGIPCRNECQPKNLETTEPMTPSPIQISKTSEIRTEANGREDLGERIESTNGDIVNRIQSTDLTCISREEEEDAAVSKLLEILDETQQTALSEKFDTEDIVEKTVKGVCSVTSDTAYDMEGTTAVGLSQIADEIDKWHEEIKPMTAIDATTSSSIPLVQDIVKPFPVKKPWNEMNEKNGPSDQQETHRYLVKEINHTMSVDPGGHDHNDSVSQISKTKADAEGKSRKIERWHKEIKPIIALAVNSSSSSSSVENEIRQNHSEDYPRTTPTVELQVYMKGDEATKDKEGVSKKDALEQSKVIPKTSSSSAEYVTADETDLHSRAFEERRTPDPCISIKTEPCDEPPQSSVTPQSNSPRVFADCLTTSGQYGDDGILDGGIDKAASGDKGKTHGPAKHGRVPKKRRQDIIPNDQAENTPETSFPMASSSSDTSVTSNASSFTSSTSSSSRITTCRKSRGKKRRRKTEKHRNRSGQKSKRDGDSPKEGHLLKEKRLLHQDEVRNDSECDAPSKSCETKSSPRRPNTNKPSSDQEDEPVDLQDAGRTDHMGEGGSGDESSGEFVIADQSPTSLKILMRRSSRLKIRRASKLPRLRSKQKASVTFKMNAYRRLVQGKVKKTEKRTRRVK